MSGLLIPLHDDDDHCAPSAMHADLYEAGGTAEIHDRSGARVGR